MQNPHNIYIMQKINPSAEFFRQCKEGFFLSGKKKMLVACLLAMLVLISVAIGLVWHMQHYRMVDFKFYPKDAQSLDLRGEEVSIKHFNKLSRSFPDCEILWDVPFQDALYSSNTDTLTVQTLTSGDVEMLDYFPQLQTLHAEDCTDYSLLLALMTRRPELQVYYQLTLDGKTYDQNAQSIRLNGVTAEELALLPCLRQLKSVVIGGGEDLTNVDAVRDYCHEKGLELAVAVGDATIVETAKTLEATGITDGELALLQYLPQLEQVHLIDPVASAENVLALRDSRTDLDVSWELVVWGILCTSEDEEIDLSEGTYATLEAVEQAMEYFPDAETVFLGLCGIDNEEIAAYRERSREKYKVVWVVDLSGKMQVRTDIDNFMPSRDGWGYVRDGEIDNIRYCEDLICMDIGHMGVKDVSFLETLVNLEYLILAHTEVQYIDAISNCKKLRFLELDWSCIRDLSPLVECTALEDLNIGNTWPDITPVLEMTWLNNLYMIFGSGGDAWKATQALPDTHVVASGNATVGSGWRKLPNYYAMRDILGMPYMHG